MQFQWDERSHPVNNRGDTSNGYIKNSRASNWCSVSSGGGGVVAPYFFSKALSVSYFTYMLRPSASYSSLPIKVGMVFATRATLVVVLYIWTY